MGMILMSWMNYPEANENLYQLARSHFQPRYIAIHLLLLAYIMVCSWDVYTSYSHGWPDIETMVSYKQA